MQRSVSLAPATSLARIFQAIVERNTLSRLAATAVENYLRQDPTYAGQPVASQPSSRLGQLLKQLPRA
jgi:hypothetical protein